MRVIVVSDELYDELCQLYGIGGFFEVWGNDNGLTEALEAAQPVADLINALAPQAPPSEAQGGGE